MKKESEDLIGQVALALSVSVLHILCQPRYTMDDDATDGIKPEDYGLVFGRAPGRIPVERLKLLVGLGFFCAAAPTNLVLKRQGSSNVGKIGGMAATGMGVTAAMYACGVGACGSCGGCGGCGGGVRDVLGAPSAVLWGSSHTGAGCGIMDVAGDGMGFEGFDAFANQFCTDYGGSGGADGDGGGDCGGDGGGDGGGGGCGGCGGCGG